MYQIFAYMANLRTTEPAERRVEGVLVYPSTNPTGFDLRWHVHGMPLRVTSLNLAADWQNLRAALHGLLSEADAQAAVT
jgi:hypothetical protein